MTHWPAPRRLGELLDALLQEHGEITSLQAGRLIAGDDTTDVDELLVRGRTWCADLRSSGYLLPGTTPDTWTRPR